MKLLAHFRPAAALMLTHRGGFLFLPQSNLVLHKLTNRAIMQIAEPHKSLTRTNKSSGSGFVLSFCNSQVKYTVNFANCQRHLRYFFNFADLHKFQRSVLCFMTNLWLCAPKRGNRHRMLLKPSDFLTLPRLGGKTERNQTILHCVGCRIIFLSRLRI